MLRQMLHEIHHEHATEARSHYFLNTRQVLRFLYTHDIYIKLPNKASAILSISCPWYL